MKLSSNQMRSAKCAVRSFEGVKASRRCLRLGIDRAAGFTMIEIALCLAIIGFALVSILLVLPSGMNTQRENRELTIINEDASLLMEAIRGGARGMDELTNNVYAITNYQGYYDNRGVFLSSHTWGYTYNAASWDGVSEPSMPITNGLRIIGILSTPEFFSGTSSGNLNTGGLPLSDTTGTFFTSNHVVAYVRSASGLAAEKPPQDNQIMQGDTFTYRVFCVNAPLATDTNMFANSGFTRQMAGNVKELRLMYEWPQLPNGNVGGYRQNYRASISGQLIVTNYGNYFANIRPLYFYQSQLFTNTP